MSKLVYDGVNHTIELLDCAAQSRGKWTAYNNIDSAYARAHYASARHLTNGVYTVTDQWKPTPKPVDENGGYGSHGIIHFNYPGHQGVGVHSGRLHWPRTPGPKHATHGCIRTTDIAMAAISAVIKADALVSVTVTGNSVAAASHGHLKHGETIAGSAPVPQSDAR